jgi:hypothetical protein
MDQLFQQEIEECIVSVKGLTRLLVVEQPFKIVSGK